MLDAIRKTIRGFVLRELARMVFDDIATNGLTAEDEEALRVYLGEQLTP